jgi:hypothetical protein
MRVRDGLLVAYLAFAGAALTGLVLRGPLTADGLVLGLPAGLFGTVALAFATFAALAAYDAAGGADDQEPSPKAGSEEEPRT